MNGNAITIGKDPTLLVNIRLAWNVFWTGTLAWLTTVAVTHGVKIRKLYFILTITMKN
jgi:hypothetical protein